MRSLGTLRNTYPIPRAMVATPFALDREMIDTPQRLEERERLVATGLFLRGSGAPSPKHRKHARPHAMLAPAVHSPRSVAAIVAAARVEIAVNRALAVATRRGKTPLSPRLRRGLLASLRALVRVLERLRLL